ncbi:MAG: hypothetical protein HYU66_09120 [Armatimonadetes bacterium]|nr:hypothetical protein [Armatimonadota bacterium]
MNTEWRDRLASYDDEGLDARERAALERLLDSDAEARAYLAELRRDRQRFTEAYASVTARPGFTEAVMQRLPQKRPAWLPLPRVLELCAAGLMVWVVVSLISPAEQLEHRRQLVCQAGMKDISRALLSYAQDYDNRLPDADQWFVQVNNPTYRPLQATCPSDPRHGSLSYAMPLGIGGADVRRLPVSQVMLFDADGVFPAPRHDRGANVGRLDGSVQLIAGPRLGGVPLRR